MKVFGPYTRKDGRKHVILYELNKVRRTVSYPKFLLEQKLGIQLNKNETVDHINNDYTNDDFSNLQVLTRADNIRKSNIAKIINVSCGWCGNNFTLLLRVYKYRITNKNKSKRVFCSVSCGSKYQYRGKK